MENQLLRSIGATDARIFRVGVHPRGAILHRQRLSVPFDSIELVFAVTELPRPKGSGVINWAAGILVLILTVGMYLIYRLGLRQLTLSQQQEDFVSAVSHELKTPLTSIRMYGEILREGWADEEKRREYYDYIHTESERLSRLIDNVLQLARMKRNDISVHAKDVTVKEVLDIVRSSIESPISAAGYTLDLHCDEVLKALELRVDTDLLAQIIINLVDNAIKFSAKSSNHSISIRIERSSDKEVSVCIRDYGPGIDKKHLKRIFNLFYRAENELTRETAGTGIGLALVSQLVRSMGGKVDVVNKEPGCEFRVILPLAFN